MLKHIWNNEDQAAILESIVTPVLEALLPRSPERAPRRAPAGIGIEALAGEIDRVRQVLTGGGGLSRRPALQPAQGAERDQGGARRIARSARAGARSARRSAPRGRFPQRPLRAALMRGDRASSPVRSTRRRRSARSRSTTATRSSPRTSRARLERARRVAAADDRRALRRSGLDAAVGRPLVRRASVRARSRASGSASRR